MIITTHKQFPNYKRYEIEYEGRPLVMETGKLAELCNSAVLVSYGETTVLVTCTASARPKDGVDYFPLSVDFNEKLYAVGRIPGSFMRREGKPSLPAVLASRLIDRPMRPLFPSDLRNDVIIACEVLSVDRDCSPEITAMIGASAAVSISDVPFNGPIAGISLGWDGEKYLFNPTKAERETNRMTVTVAATHKKVVMIEAAAKEAARQSLLSEYDGVQLTEAVRLRSAADNDTATSLTIDSGKVARLNDYQDGWYQVTFGQSTGYIPAEYAQPVHYADYEGTSATNTVREELIAYAYTYLGTPYVYGGSSYSGTDCSGFTMAVFAKFGYSLSHGASDQYYTATSVSSEERQAGDLVFFDTFGGISHVGIYLGGGQFIHASSSGGVKVNSLYESYYAACYLGAGRILP